MLRAQVERKLKKAFDAADVSHTGSLTRQQANAAGLGLVARHFDQIDRQNVGAARFVNVKRFLIERGAPRLAALARQRSDAVRVSGA